MTRRAGAVLIALLALAVAGTAVAATRHKVDSTVKTAQVDSKGSTSISAGTFVDRISKDRGAVVFRTTPVQGSATNFTQTFVVFSKRGTVKGSGTVTASSTPNPDGTVSFTATSKVTDGTGRYRNATGTLKATGSIDPRTSRATSRVTGTLRY